MPAQAGVKRGNLWLEQSLIEDRKPGGKPSEASMPLGLGLGAKSGGATRPPRWMIVPAKAQDRTRRIGRLQIPFHPTTSQGAMSLSLDSAVWAALILARRSTRYNGTPASARKIYSREANRVAIHERSVSSTESSPGSYGHS